MAAPQLDNVTGLRCVSCDAEVPLSDAVYLCPTCQGNLQVEYDYDRIRSEITKDSLRDDRDLSMWRYAPFYPVTTRIEAPSIGWTPLYRSEALGESVGLDAIWVKDDGRNPSASFKDRASAIALLRAKELGHELVTGASTGNAASSTAVLAAGLKIRTRIFIPAAAPRAKVAQLLAFGAEVLAVDGTYDQAFDLCLDATARFGWYNRNTGFNPFTREGKKSVSFEICEQLDWQVPDVVAVPVGDGNIISGVWKGFVDLRAAGFIDRLPRLLAVQAEGSAAIIDGIEGDGTIKPVSGDTVADSISVSLPRDGLAAIQAVVKSGGFGVRVPDDEILAAIPEVARLAGVFGEPAGVTAFAGIKRAAAAGQLKRGERVVMLVTGNGLKDVASVMKVTGEPTAIAADPAALTAAFGTP